MADAPESDSAVSRPDAQHEKTIREEDRQASPVVTAVDNEPVDIEELVKELGGMTSEDSSEARRLGVMFKDLRVVGTGFSSAIQHDLVSPWYPQSILGLIERIRRPPLRDIISGFEGVVLPGEMLLVLGRPGSGCSTLLKTLANDRGDYHAVLGDVFYDSFTSYEVEKLYRGDVLYCPEDDIHFPTLTVGETLKFAAMVRGPDRDGDRQSRKARAMRTAELLMRIFGLERARNTVVGDASIRGISGGQKKRVSLAEVMSARGKLVCWDNSTRGLDSSTALEFIRALRAMTDTTKVTTVASIYQAGEQLFDLFDKVCLIYEGKMTYFGPAREAKQYFMDMGYQPQNRQTTPDFLVAVTDPNARMICPGFGGVVPRTADEMASHFKSSSYGELNRSSMDSYHSLYVNKSELKMAYERSAMSEHSQFGRKSEAYVLSVPRQIIAVMHRRWQIMQGDLITLSVQLGTQIFQAIFMGTVYFRTGHTTANYFSRGGVLYFALFCGGISSMSEIPALFSQRQIVRRHQKAAFYFPFIHTLAHVIVDIPITLIAIAVFSVILYFLVDLQKSAQQFFTFYLFTFMSTFVMKTCFRSIAASSTTDASALAVAGVVIVPLTLYTGYTIPKADINAVLSWLMYLNPLRYAFESLLVNEFHTIDGICTTLVPSGPLYQNVTPANQACTTLGSQPGSLTVPGDAYTDVSFGYTYSDLWRNLGILWAFAFGLLVILLFFTQYNKKTAWDTTVTLYKQGSQPASVHEAADEEKAVSRDHHYESNELDVVKHAPKPAKLGQSDIFSWNNVEYEVPISKGKMRRLLDNVSGYVAPGKLTALMGESGAGKTTLLNVLAERASIGVVRGDRLVNGHALPVDFQAQTAYVQQMDVHLPESTVREALLFSARLRQPSSVPLAEKEAYVDQCLKMCGLEAYADAIVGSLGVEHKKRTTIGVELAAKPKLLLFLDEPTSGLDSQSAWAIVKFLRELADNGQAILCTIHQPSGELFQVFDRLLLLRRGGQTVYFGDIGERSMTMIKYFERNGAPCCPEDANPAEYMLDVIGAGATSLGSTDWHQTWKDSPEAADLEREIQHIHHEGRSRPPVSTGIHSEFASSWVKQLGLLVQRGFVCYWRNPMYIYPKLVVPIFAGLLIGFTFFGLSNTLQGCQDKLFSVFLATTVLSIPMAQQMQGKCISTRTVYEIRERPSRMYTWTTFVLSQILIEIPWSMLAGVLLFVCWYWTSSFTTSRAPFSLLFFVVFPLYPATLGQLAAAISPTPVVGTTFISASMSFIMVFSGILQRYSNLGWWKWMWHVSPYKYVVEGYFGQALGHQLITCASTELIMINPPDGMTCATYMDPYISDAGGYLTNPNATAQCEFCQFRTTDELLREGFNILDSHHWRDLGAIIGFVGANIFLTFVCFYIFQMRKGMGGPLARVKRHLAENR